MPGIRSFLGRRLQFLSKCRSKAWFRPLLKAVDFPVSVRWGNIRYRVRFLRDLPLILRDSGEPEMHEAFGRVLASVGATHFIDVGANVGTYAWHALQASPGLFVFLIEPDPLNAGLLRQTIRNNSLNRVDLWEGAAAASSGTREFVIDDVSGATGSLHEHRSNPGSLHTAYRLGRKILVPTTTLDAYASRIPPGAQLVIKIDVEGAEIEVLEGAMRLVDGLRPAIFVESFERSAQKTIEARHYRSFEIDERGNQLLVPEEKAAGFISQGIVREKVKGSG